MEEEEEEEGRREEEEKGGGGGGGGGGCPLRRGQPLYMQRTSHTGFSSQSPSSMSLPSTSR